MAVSFPCENKKRIFFLFAIFQQLGITMSDAINMFLHQSILHGGLPFEVKIPKYNAETMAALADMEQSKGKGIRGEDVRSVLTELKDDSEGAAQ